MSDEIINTTIYIKSEVLKALEKIKKEYELNSYNEVIKFLLLKAGYL